VSRIAVVVQRYGREVGGGAETHARQVAERLNRRHDVTVLTTCARDYLTWADHYPAGPDAVGGVAVLRFPVPIPRDPHQFHAVHVRVVAGDRDPATERRFLAEQGPDTPALIGHLHSHGHGYEAVIFFTALYGTTLLGLPPVAGRSILVPTLHDEAPMRLAAYRRVLPRAGFVLYNTPEERALARRLYPMPEGRDAIAGIGVTPATVDTGAARRHRLTRPYLLYAGRIDRDKGCPELLQNFLAMTAVDSRLDLVLVGSAAMDVPAHPRIHLLGYLANGEVAGILSCATAAVVPSRMESLSMVTLEAMAAGVPVLVPSDSPVLVGHVRRSSGGILYDDGYTFAEASRMLAERPELVARLGANGRRYVAANFSWERVDALYDLAIDRVTRAGRVDGAVSHGNGSDTREEP